MAIKYRLSFSSFNNQNVVIELSSTKWTGSLTSILGVGGESFSLMVNGGDSNPFNSHIITTTANVSAYTDLIDVDDLQLSNDKDWLLVAKVNGSVKFQGFLIPDGIQRTRKGAGNLVKLSATCGLSLLDSKYYHSTTDLVTVDGQPSVRNSPLGFIRNIINDDNNMGNQLPIRWSCSLKASDFSTRDFFAGALIWGNGEALIDLLNFNQLTSHYIIENLVKSAKCWIVQQDGYWNIISYEDLIRNSGILTFNVITSGTGNKTATKQTLNLNVDLTNLGIEDNHYSYYSKAIGKAVVYYDHLQLENIIPNGGMDHFSTGNIINWEFKGGGGSASAYDSLNERSGLSVMLSGSKDDAEFTLVRPLNIDANVLYNEMTFGFTIMPVSGFPITDYDTIDWDKQPLKIKVAYTIDRGGVTEEYYLNEFGYWSNNNANAFGQISSKQFIGSTYAVVVDPKGFREGDLFSIVLNRSGTLYSYKIVIPRDMSANNGVDYIASQIPNTDTPTSPITNNKTLIFNAVTVDSATNASITIHENYYKYILLKSDRSAINDIVSFTFQSKGGSTLIKIPDPSSLYSSTTTAGKFTISFFVNNGQRYALDDVWMRLNGNQDVFEVAINDKNDTENYHLGISSSFSGFMLSSYMANFGSAEKMMNFNDYSASGKRLTELYGRTVVNWMGDPRMIYHGSFKSNLISAISFITIGSKKFISLGHDNNLHTGNSDNVRCFEALIANRSPTVGHNVFTDEEGYSGVSYGNSSSSGGGGILQDLQSVTDIGAESTNIITVKGVRALDLFQLPDEEPPIEDRIAGKTYMFRNNTGSGSNPPPALGNLEDLQNVANPIAANKYLYKGSDGIWRGVDISLPDLSSYATQSWVTTQLGSYVPTSRTINGKALTGDITLNASDVGALTQATADGRYVTLATKQTISGAKNFSGALGIPNDEPILADRVTGVTYLYRNATGGGSTPPPTMGNLEDLQNVQPVIANGKYLQKVAGVWTGVDITFPSLAGYALESWVTAGFAPLAGYNKSNWDTAFGWGNHALVNYFKYRGQLISGVNANSLSQQLGYYFNTTGNGTGNSNFPSPYGYVNTYGDMGSENGMKLFHFFDNLGEMTIRTTWQGNVYPDRKVWDSVNMRSDVANDSRYVLKTGDVMTGSLFVKRAGNLTTYNNAAFASFAFDGNNASTYLWGLGYGAIAATQSTLPTRYGFRVFSGIDHTGTGGSALLTVFADGRSEFTGRVDILSPNEGIRIVSTSSANTPYLSYYEQGNVTRMGYIGYPTTANRDMYMYNGKNGNIQLMTLDGYGVVVNTKLQAPAIRATSALGIPNGAPPVAQREAGVTYLYRL